VVKKKEVILRHTHTGSGGEAEPIENHHQRHEVGGPDEIIDIDASHLTYGTLDGDRLPAISTTKRAGVPATGTPANNFLRDDDTWAAVGMGGVPTCDDGSITTTTFENLKTLMKISADSGSVFSNAVLSTFSLLFTINPRSYDVWGGGVMALNGDIHFVPCSSNQVGQKVNKAGAVSTYAIVLTDGTESYKGGVLAANGDIHFIPNSTSVGQKISAAGIVSTYSLPYTTSGAYWGGVLDPNGEIYFVPFNAKKGTKISVDGTVSTFSLPYTCYYAYCGGVLAPNGDIHFVPYTAAVGMKVSGGVVSTYALAKTFSTGSAYCGGVLSQSGEIHFVPAYATVGQKISAGVLSTYSLACTIAANGYAGGVLAPDGTIYFVPYSRLVGEKISPAGVVSTYSMTPTAANGWSGGVLAADGSIYFIPARSNTGLRLYTFPGIPFSRSVCLSSFFNKY
jgi:streptogramin lyase